MLNIRHYLSYILSGLLFPGIGFAYNGRIIFAITIPLSIILILTLLSITRLITEPIGLVLFLVCFLFILIFSALGPIFIYNKQKTSFFHVIFYALIITLFFLALYIYKPVLLGLNLYVISSRSMEPTFYENDVILVDTWIYQSIKPIKEDIVIFHRSDNEKRKYIKRIVGLPNELISVSPYLIKSKVEKNHFDSRMRKIKVGAKRYFLVGDHRDHSLDSRHFGAISQKNIDAKATYIIFSQHKNSILKTL